MRKRTWKQYLSCVGHRVMKFVKKRRTVGWLLALVVWLAVIECGMNTAELGTRKDCHGILQVDSSVKPQYLMTRLPLAGAGIGERAPVIDLGYTKYSYLCRHQRQSNKKYQGSPPPLWLQKLLYRTLLTVLYIKRTSTHIFQSTRVLLQFTVSYVRALPALLRARMLVSITALSVKTLFSALCSRHIRKAIGHVLVVQRRMYCGAHAARYRIRQVMETRPLPFVTTQVLLNVCVVYADQPHCTTGHGMTKGRFRDFTKVREGVTGISTRPRQWLCTKTKLVLILLLCLVLWRCGLVCHLTGYDVGVIEMLLMMSGDVVPNPGPVGVLRPKDLRVVLTELLPACADWYNIGLALDMDLGILDGMEGPYKTRTDCLREMLREWLKTAPDASWEGLIKALKDPIVGHSALASQLETKYSAQAPPQAAQPVEVTPQHSSVMATGTEPPAQRLHMYHAQERSGLSEVCAPAADGVQRDVESLKEQFGSLVESAYHGVEQITTLLEFRRRISSKEYKYTYGDFFHSEYLSDLPDGATFKDTWDKLSNYWNYFNFGLLEHVVSQFGDGDLKQKMESYLSKLDSFKQKTNLGAFVKDHRTVDHTGRTDDLKQLVVEYKCSDLSCCTLSQVEEVKRALMKHLDIPKVFLVDIKIPVDGCVSVTWFVPASAVGTMEVRLLHCPYGFLKNKGIMLITFDGEVYYTAELETLAKELRMTYDIQRPVFLELQWPPPPTRKVFNLAMIRSWDPIRRQPPNEELVGLLMRGSVCVYLRQHTSVSLANLFKLDYNKRKVVLIEGAPGAGKSTLAWEICQKWKACEMFKNFQIVIYVQLRDPWIQSATSLADLLLLPSEEFKEHVMTQMKTCRGIRTLFVLDGWDEYEPGLRQGSLFHKLVCEPHMLQLHYSTVLVTSRPIASCELQPYATSRVEILGFTQEELRRYFSEALGDPAQVHHLYEQFKERPVIEASCYLPLNAAIVAHIFMELNSTLPRTLHGVFSAVVCGCIRRYLKKQTGREEEVPSLDQIPLEVNRTFQSICTLAYVGSVMNKVTFSGQELQKYGLSSEGNALDLMQVVQSFASRRSKLCHFLHLSVQELLTALKISKLAPPEQVQAFQDMFNNPRFAAVFRFYAAITRLKTKGIMDIVVDIVRNREKHVRPLLNLLHCLYEAQDVSLCCFVASQLNEKLNLHHVALSPLDCISIGYFLSCLYQYTGGEFKVQFKESLISSSNCRFLAHGLSICSHAENSGPPASACVTLELTGEIMGQNTNAVNFLIEGFRNNTSVSQVKLHRCNPKFFEMEDSGPLLVKMLRNNRTLQELDLSDSAIDARALGYIVEGLRHNTGLVKLLLHNCSLSVTEDNGPLLVEMLRENRTLQELDLSHSPIGASGLGYIAKGLRYNTGLLKLPLPVCSVSMTEDNGPLLDQMLRENKTLQELNLSHNHIGASGLRHMAKGLRHNTGLVKLSLQKCSVSVTEDNGPLLDEMLRENLTLQELDLFASMINASGLGYIANGLRHNTKLVSLSLCRCFVSVTEDNGPLLEEMLRENGTLQKLDLSYSPIGASGLGYIAKGLQNNTKVVKLLLRSCHFSITEDNGPLLAMALRVNSTLEELDLSDNKIHDEDLVVLVESLSMNTGLKTLHVNRKWQPILQKVQEARQKNGLPPLKVVSVPF